MSSAEPLFTVRVVETATGKVVYESTASPKRRTEKIEDGLSINLNHAAFHTEIVQFANA